MILALLCCGVLANNYQTAPTAGNIGLVLNTTSVENILTTALPLACYFALNNKTIELDITDKSSWAYTLVLESVHIDKVSLSKPVFEQLPGTDKIHVRLTGINIDTDLKGQVKALHFIPINAEQVSIKNATVDMIIQSTADDNVHWQLNEVTTMNFQNIDIKLKNKALQKIAGWFKGIINKLINKFVPKQLNKLIETQINDINAMVTNQTEYTWDLGLISKDYPLNMTMTKAPEIAKNSHLIKLNFDGTFHKKGGHLKPYTHDYFPDISGTHREQLWIHETTFNTLVSSAMDHYKSFKMSSPAMNTTLLTQLPELKEICGDSCNLTIAFYPKDTDAMVTLTMKNGIVIGGPETKFVVQVMANSDSDDVTKSVLTFETAMQMDVNFTMSNVVFYPVFKSVNFQGTTLTNSAVKMGTHMYDLVLKTASTQFGQDWNKKYAVGVPIAALDPDLAMIGGLIKNSTMSPYIADGWMYAGFSMAADQPYYHQLYEDIQFTQHPISEETNEFLQ